jgi:hypothetical protein
MLNIKIYAIGLLAALAGGAEMTYRTPIPCAHGTRRKTCNVQQARELLSHETPPSRQHVYNLFHRGDIEGYFLGQSRGLRIYADTIERHKRRNTAEALLADPEVKPKKRRRKKASC